MIFPLSQLAVSGVSRAELVYILALTHRQVLFQEQRVSPDPCLVLLVTKLFVVVRIPPSAVLSYKNAPAIPPSCLRVSLVNESRHNGIPYITIPIPPDQPEEDPEFTLAFALTVQMSATPPRTNSNETHLTLIQDPWTS